MSLEIAIPGGFDANYIWPMIERTYPEFYYTGKYKILIPSRNNSFPLYNYYISRYQVWKKGSWWKAPGGCKGNRIGYKANKFEIKSLLNIQ